MQLTRLSQGFRRACQLSVVVFVAYAALGGPFRNYKVAHNHRRIVALSQGETWGALYGLNEDLLSWFGESYRTSMAFLAFPWGARVFGIDTADPLLVLSHAISTQRIVPSLWLASLAPVVLALTLGKLFCSYICPMRLLFELGEAARRGLTKLGLTLPSLRSPVRLGGWVLVGGLLGMSWSGIAIWFLLLPYVAFASALHLLVATGIASVLWLVVGALLLVDTSLAPGFFCHNLCPTGFVLEQLGRVSRLRLARVDREACPGGCERCKTACPYHLFPAEETHRPACDACGRCAPACPKGKLARRLPILATLLLIALTPLSALAHHNKGLPHYGYFENYPQVPTEEYIAVEGPWEIGATIFNFQGMDRGNASTPNDVKIYLYLYNLDTDRNHLGEIDVEIRRDGKLVSRFARLHVDTEAVYSTRETLPESGRYELVAHLGEATVVLPFYVSLAQDRLPWSWIAIFTLPVVALFGLSIHGRKRGRRRTAAAAALSLMLALSPGSAALGQAQSVSAARDVTQEAGAQAERCPHCGMVNCTMPHYETAEGAQVMVMGGIPLWLFLSGVAGLLSLTFAGVEWLGAKPTRGFRLNLLDSRKLYRIARSRWLQAIPQLLSIVLFFGLIWAGLVGSRFQNVAPIAVWTVWWAGLIFAVLMFASAWCFVCPWDGLANLMSRLRLSSKVEPLNLDLPFPKWAENVYPAIGLFALLTWLELGYGVTTNPRSTALMGIGMAALAVAFALMFRGKKFCAYVCPVGRICGIYSNISPIEVRARKAATCRKCRTEDCLHGNREGYACPTGISLKTVSDATYCTMCTECIKSCDKQNVALNLRPFGADLRAPTRIPRMDEAWLAVSLLSLTLFHGLSMTPAWESHQPGAFSILKWLSLSLGIPRTLAFSLGMLVATALPVGLYWLCCELAARWAKNGVTARTLFRSYAYSLLPVALFYHLAHNAMHLLMEGGELVPLLSNPLGRGTDYFATASLHVGSLISESWLWYLQVGLILIGHLFGIVVAHRVGHSLYRDRSAALRSLATIPVLMVLISVGGLWLMHMDMNMRGGRM